VARGWPSSCRGQGEAVRQLAAANGCTPFMVLLATLQVLLMRYSASEVIRVGVPIANRNRAEVEGLIGFFVNTQVLQVELDGRHSFVEVLAQVRQRVLGQANQDLPFEHLVDALQPQRSLDRTRCSR
jgi:non-ribosomal peptide synthetase component F